MQKNKKTLDSHLSLSDGKQLLEDAVKAGNLTMVRFLYEHGTDFSDVESLIEIAKREGDEHMEKYLVKKSNPQSLETNFDFAKNSKSKDVIPPILNKEQKRDIQHISIQEFFREQGIDVSKTIELK